MTERPSILRQLEEARVLNPEGLTEDQREAINKLTEAEVKQLISIRRKVGDFSHAHRGGCAWIL